MDKLRLPERKKSAKQFLLKLVPSVLNALDLKPEAQFWGFKFNIEAEVNRRIWAMSEETAAKALDALKEVLKEW